MSRVVKRPQLNSAHGASKGYHLLLPPPVSSPLQSFGATCQLMRPKLTMRSLEVEEGSSHYAPMLQLTSNPNLVGKLDTCAKIWSRNLEEIKDLKIHWDISRIWNIKNKEVFKLNSIFVQHNIWILNQNELSSIQGRDWPCKRLIDDIRAWPEPTLCLLEAKVDMGHRNSGQGLYITLWKNSRDTVSCETCLKFCPHSGLF